MTQSDTKSLVTRQSIVAIAGLALLAIATRPLLADPLDAIRGKVPGVVVFPDMPRAVAHWNMLVREVHPDAEGLSVEDFTVDAFPDQEMWDHNSAVAFVLARPEFRWRSLVVVFTPADKKAVLEKYGAKEGRITRCEGLNGRFYLLIRDKVGYISERRRSIRMVSQSKGATLAKSLDRREREMYSKGDVFARFSLSPFRASVQQYVGVALAMARFGMASGSGQTEKSAKVVDAMFGWFTERFRSLVLQLDTAAIAVDVNDDRYCLSHHLRFACNGGIADCLSRVRSERHAVTASLPDRPFFVIGGANWKCPVGDSITVQLSEDLMDHVAVDMSPADRKKFLKNVRACYGQMSGSTFFVGPSNGNGLPVALVGSYFMGNAEKGIGQLCFMQEHAGETMGAFLTGSSFFGEFEDREKGGVKFRDMAFNPDSMPEPVRKQTVMMYGDKPRFQVAVAGQREVAYYMGQSKDGVCSFLSERKSGKTLDQNRDVSKIMDWLPDNPNMVMVLDFGSIIGSLPSLMAMAADQAGAEKETMLELGPVIAPSQARGLLVGWGIKVEDGAIAGQLVVARHDIEKAIQLVKEMKSRVAATSK